MPQNAEVSYPEFLNEISNDPFWEDDALLVLMREDVQKGKSVLLIDPIASRMADLDKQYSDQVSTVALGRYGLNPGQVTLIRADDAYLDKTLRIMAQEVRKIRESGSQASCYVRVNHCLYKPDTLERFLSEA